MHVCLYAFTCAACCAISLALMKRVIHLGQYQAVDGISSRKWRGETTSWGGSMVRVKTWGSSGWLFSVFSLASGVIPVVGCKGPPKMDTRRTGAGPKRRAGAGVRGGDCLTYPWFAESKRDHNNPD